MLADGRQVRASADEHPELFWAHPRRRRQLRRRDLVPVPAARGRHDLRRPDVLAGGAERGGPLRLPRVPAERAARAQRLLRVPHRAARPAVPGGDPPARGVRGRLVLRSAARTTRGARWRPCWTRCPSRCSTASRPMPHAALQGAFDGLYPPGDQWYWRADFVNEVPDEAVAAPRSVRRRDADHEVDDAPVPDRRRRARHGSRRHGVELPRRPLGVRVRRRRPRPGQRRRDPPLEHRLPRGAAPVLGRRRLREHDDGRGPGAGPRELPRQLRPARAASRQAYDPANTFRVNQNIEPA